MKRSRQDIELSRPLPPIVPEDDGELEQAVQLLGAYVQVDGKLRASSRLRLQELVGFLPSVAVAKEWKRALKELRAEAHELDSR